MTEIKIDPSDIQWRVGSTYERNGKLMGQLLGYINARTAMEKLDALDPAWNSDIFPIVITDGAVVAAQCKLTVAGVTRSDVGVSALTDIDPTKTAYSDAFKRAAVHHGIARELYDLPYIAVECERKSNGKAGAPKVLPVLKNDKWTVPSEFGFVRYSEVAEEERSTKKPIPQVTENVTSAEVAAMPEATPQDLADADDPPANQRQKNLVRVKAKEMSVDDRQLAIIRENVTHKHSSKDLLNSDIDKLLAALADAATIGAALTGGTVE